MNQLRQYFPFILTRDEIRKQIANCPEWQETYDSWKKEDQETFLQICSGEKGPMMLSDTMFKEMMSPETVPGRLEDFLSVVLGMQVHIVKLLPNEEHSIEDNYSLLVFDILVELEDGSLANVEMQRMGYFFPGARAACYSADLLLRQYKRLRSEKKRKEERFTYSQIKNVYTIILYEKSPSCFHEFPEHYIHHFAQKSDTGLKMELLQEYIMIPLDIFRRNEDNKDTMDKLCAWIWGGI